MFLVLGVGKRTLNQLEAFNSSIERSQSQVPACSDLFNFPKQFKGCPYLRPLSIHSRNRSFFVAF